jgi:3-(3-hydroxy-phenyl)propionate hydroxylase
LLNLGERGRFDVTAWQGRVRVVDAEYVGAWELPVIRTVTAPSAVLVRPDGYVAWVGGATQQGLVEALTNWFGACA